MAAEDGEKYELLIADAAARLRGLAIDPSIPLHARRSLVSAAASLEAALREMDAASGRRCG